MMRHQLTSIAAALLMAPVLAAYPQSTPDNSALRPPTANTSQTTGSDGNDLRRAAGAMDSDPLVSALANDTGGSEPVALPADRIIEILQAHPALLAQAKRSAAARLQQQGAVADGISDDELFQLIEQNAEVRAAFTQQLSAQGYLTRDDHQELGEHEDGNAEAKAESPHNRPSTRSTSTGAEIHESDPNAPTIVAQPNPYPDVPALKDLYSQAGTQSAPVRRFGMEIFRGSGLADNGSLDLPVGPDYILGPGDHIAIGLAGGISQRFTREVDREGKILLPEAGAIVVAGKTLADAQRLIQQVLTPYYRNLKTDVSLSRVRTVRVYVVGEVQRPGAYDVSSLSTPLNALYAAGGITGRGSLRSIRHLRGEELVREIDLYEFLLYGKRADTERLEPGDTILVPPVGPQVTLTGMVRRPGIYELRKEKNLAEVMDLAGGVLISGALRQIRVERIEAHQGRVMLSVNLPDGSSADDMRRALGSVAVQDGDHVSVAPILPYSTQTVYLEGHVSRPGKYPYRPGMDVGALLRSYRDVLPEPADHAEIIRLEPPDYRPKVIAFDLSEVLGGTDPVELQPFDTVRIFGRYEIDAPKVSIVGEVLHPGQYPLSEGMTAAALVEMAGGFKRSAYTSTADIASYAVENGEKVAREHTTVEISKALGGERRADVVLKPGDVVSIRQLTGWNDIGASVVLKGEVRYPGTYGIEDGERLSSVLKRAGGMRPTAYPAGAMLERVEVRELAEKSRVEMIHRIESAGSSLKLRGIPSGDAAAAAQLMAQQQRQILTTLRQEHATGRLVIRISADLHRWENTAADPELRAGDVISIPKRPNFVLVNGQVYSPAAIGYVPGKPASWYLRQAGGPTDSASRKEIFIIRANGSVLAGSGEGFWRRNVLDARMQPGDTLAVPERIVTGSAFWKNLLSTAQLSSSIAVAARIAASF